MRVFGGDSPRSASDATVNGTAQRVITVQDAVVASNLDSGLSGLF